MLENAIAADASTEPWTVGSLDELGLDGARGDTAMRVLAALAALAPDAVAPLTDALMTRVFNRGDLARRVALADALAALATPATVDLVGRLGARDAEERMLAARALTSPHHAPAVDSLAARLMDDREAGPVRVACARALAGQGSARGVEAVLAAAFSEDDDVRGACAEALGQLPATRRSAVVLGRLATDDACDVRVRALSALLTVGGPAARRAGQGALMRDDAPSRAAALLVLSRHGTAADVTRARPALDDADARVRRAACACVQALVV